MRNGMDISLRPDVVIPTPANWSLMMDVSSTGALYQNGGYIYGGFIFTKDALNPLNTCMIINVYKYLDGSEYKVKIDSYWNINGNRYYDNASAAIAPLAQGEYYLLEVEHTEDSGSVVATLTSGNSTTSITTVDYKYYLDQFTIFGLNGYGTSMVFDNIVLIPEPATVVLLISGSIGFVFRRRYTLKGKKLARGKI